MSQDSNRSKVPQPKRIDQLLKEFGFRPDAPVSTARALIVNLVRSAYGHEAARDFIRQMNLSENQDVKSPHEDPEFQKSVLPRQLRLFDDTGTD